MKIFLFAFSILLGFGNLSIAQTTESTAVKTTPLDATWLFWRDGRLIRDIASLRLEQIGNEQSWVMANVKPDARSGRGKTVGIHFDSKGQLVKEPNVRQRIIVSIYGTIGQPVVLAGSSQVPSTYQWEYEQNVRVPTEAESYPIFRLGPGGTAVIRINEGAEGSAKFSPAYLIADEWTPLVAPALRFIQADASLFAPNPNPERQQKLRNLLSEKNSLISIAAAHILAEANLLDTDFVSENIAQTIGLRKSVFVYLYLWQLSKSQPAQALPVTKPAAESLVEAVKKSIANETLSEALKADIGLAKDEETLKYLALGVVSSPQSNIFSSQRVNQLLREISQRQDILKNNTDVDVYIKHILDSMSIK